MGLSNAAAALAVFLLSAAPAAAVEEEWRQILDAGDSLRIDAEDSALLAAMFGLPPPGELVIRIAGFRAEDAADATRFTAGDVHLLELANGGEELMLISTRDLAGESRKDSFSARASLVEFWLPSGELAAAIGDLDISLAGGQSADVSLHVEASSLQSTMQTELPHGGSLSERSETGPIAFRFDGESEGDYREGGKFLLSVEDLAGTIRTASVTEDGTVALLAWSSGGISLTADVQPAGAGPAAGEVTFAIDAEESTVRLPGGLDAGFAALSLRLDSKTGTLTADLADLSASPALQRLLWPAQDFTLPAASVAVAFLLPTDIVSAELIKVDSLTASLGAARYQATGALAPLALSFNLEGTLSGLLAMLQSAGVGDPLAKAGEIGLNFGPNAAAADSIEFRIDGNPVLLRFNGSPVLSSGRQ